MLIAKCIKYCLVMVNIMDDTALLSICWTSHSCHIFTEDSRLPICASVIAPERACCTAFEMAKIAACCCLGIEKHFS